MKRNEAMRSDHFAAILRRLDPEDGPRRLGLKLHALYAETCSMSTGALPASLLEFDHFRGSLDDRKSSCVRYNIQHEKANSRSRIYRIDYGVFKGVPPDMFELEFETCSLQGRVHTRDGDSTVEIANDDVMMYFAPLPNHTLDIPSSAWFDSRFFSMTTADVDTSTLAFVVSLSVNCDRRVRPRYHDYSLNFHFPVRPDRCPMSIHAESQYDDSLIFSPIIEWHVVDDRDGAVPLAYGVNTVGDRQQITIANESYITEIYFEQSLFIRSFQQLEPIALVTHIATLLKHAGLIAFLDNDIQGATHLACFAIDAVEHIRSASPDMMSALKDSAQTRLTTVRSYSAYSATTGRKCDLVLGGVCIFVDEFSIQAVQFDVLVQTICLQLNEEAYKRNMDIREMPALLFVDYDYESWTKQWPALRIPCMVQMSSMLIARLVRRALRESGISRISMQDVRNIYATFQPLRRLRDVFSAFYPQQDILGKLDMLQLEIDQAALEDDGQWYGHWPQTKRRDCLHIVGITFAPGSRKHSAEGLSRTSAVPAEIQLRLVVDPELGAGLETVHTWWGLRVTVVDEEPGQTGLSTGDTITSIGGHGLAEVEDETVVNAIFKAGFCDRASITMAPQLVYAVSLPSEAQMWPTSFRRDLELLGEKGHIGVNVYDDTIEVVGPSTAMDFAKAEIRAIFDWYARSSTPFVVNFNVVGQHSLSLVELDPYKIRFTHDKISSHFRNGVKVDETIEDILDGRLDPHALPHLELTTYEGSIYSLSNRRLFVFRVLRSLGKVVVVHGVLHPWNSEAVQRMKLDIDTGVEASKWNRSYSTSNNGQFVLVKSRYESLQCRQ